MLIAGPETALDSIKRRLPPTATQSPRIPQPLLMLLSTMCIMTCISAHPHGLEEENIEEGEVVKRAELDTGEWEEQRMAHQWGKAWHAASGGFGPAGLNNNDQHSSAKVTFTSCLLRSQAWLRYHVYLQVNHTNLAYSHRSAHVRRALGDSDLKQGYCWRTIFLKTCVVFFKM